MARVEAREVIYRLTQPPGTVPVQLPLRLSRAAPHATIETTVAHLDDEGDVWRTLAVQGRPEEVAAARLAFEQFAPPFLVEKSILG
ncbi:MAG TPA: hypothetical protein VHI93_09295, partial [Candidatus Thermoplasmatota archaeon]|nr:hypothetical protein [Candidatus Thermoplasmatota archaeon]